MHKLHGIVRLRDASNFSGVVKRKIPKLANIEYVFGSIAPGTQRPRVKTVESVDVHGELIVIERLAYYIHESNSLVPYKIRQRMSDGVHASIVFPNNICKISNSITNTWPLIEDIRTHIIASEPEYKDVLDYLFNYGDSGYDCTLFAEDVISTHRLEKHILEFIDKLNSSSALTVVPDIGTLLRSPFIIEDTVSLRSMCGIDLRAIFLNMACENNVDLSRRQDNMLYNTPCTYLDIVHREILQLFDDIIITDFDITYMPISGDKHISYCIDRFQLFYDLSSRNSYTEDMFILDSACRLISTTLLQNIYHTQIRIVKSFYEETSIMAYLNGNIVFHVSFDTATIAMCSIGYINIGESFFPNK
jgi:hypothetical protein